MDAPADVQISALRPFFLQEGIELLTATSGSSDSADAGTATARYAQWITAGNHGQMDYLETHAPKKFAPDQMDLGARTYGRTVLTVAFNYYQPLPNAPPSWAAGRVARYAIGRDYHKELGNRLRRISRLLSKQFAPAHFRPFVDATPLAEKAFAAWGRLGTIGRNTLLITAKYGSWVVLGEILTNAAVHNDQTDSPNGNAPQCPAQCRRCIDECPTAALRAPYQLDARRCISYLTIEHRGDIPAVFHQAIGDRVFGCDRCQEVCPLNHRATATAVTAFRQPIAGGWLPIEMLMNFEDDESFKRRFAGSPVMRAGRARMRRNAAIVAGNRRNSGVRRSEDRYCD